MKAVNKKNDVLKSLIQKVELDKPTPNFTALVMEEVEAQNEVVINPALKSLLKRNGIEKPSVGFTHSIMSQVERCESKPAYKPIISKKVWRIIIATAVFFVLCLGFSAHASTSPGGLTPYFINIGNTLITIFTKVNSVPSLYLITFISLSALLVMDYLLRIRGQSHEKKSQTFLR